MEKSILLIFLLFYSILTYSQEGQSEFLTLEQEQNFPLSPSDNEYEFAEQAANFEKFIRRLIKVIERKIKAAEPGDWESELAQAKKVLAFLPKTSGLRQRWSQGINPERWAAKNHKRYRDALKLLKELVRDEKIDHELMAKIFQLESVTKESLSQLFPQIRLSSGDLRSQFYFRHWQAELTNPKTDFGKLIRYAKVRKGTIDLKFEFDKKESAQGKQFEYRIIVTPHIEGVPERTYTSFALHTPEKGGNHPQYESETFLARTTQVKRGVFEAMMFSLELDLPQRKLTEEEKKAIDENRKFFNEENKVSEKSFFIPFERELNHATEKVDIVGFITDGEGFSHDLIELERQVNALNRVVENLISRIESKINRVERNHDREQIDALKKAIEFLENTQGLIPKAPGFIQTAFFQSRWVKSTQEKMQDIVKSITKEIETGTINGKHLALAFKFLDANYHEDNFKDIIEFADKKSKLAFDHSFNDWLNTPGLRSLLKIARQQGKKIKLTFDLDYQFNVKRADGDTKHFEVVLKIENLPGLKSALEVSVPFEVLDTEKGATRESAIFIRRTIREKWVPALAYTLDHRISQLNLKEKIPLEFEVLETELSKPVGMIQLMKKIIGQEKIPENSLEINLDRQKFELFINEFQKEISSEIEFLKREGEIHTSGNASVIIELNRLSGLFADLERVKKMMNPDFSLLRIYSPINRNRQKKALYRAFQELKKVSMLDQRNLIDLNLKLLGHKKNQSNPENDQFTLSDYEEIIKIKASDQYTQIIWDHYKQDFLKDPEFKHLLTSLHALKTIEGSTDVNLNFEFRFEYLGSKLSPDGVKRSFKVSLDLTPQAPGNPFFHQQKLSADYYFVTDFEAEGSDYSKASTFLFHDNFKKKWMGGIKKSLAMEVVRNSNILRGLDSVFLVQKIIAEKCNQVLRPKEWSLDHHHRYNRFKP